MSEQRQYSDNPNIQWALDLLKPDPTYEPSVLQKYAAEIVFTLSGFSVACLRNIYNRRPALAGIQMHITCVVAGYFLAQVSNQVITHFKAERDTRLRNYVMLHPELFPEPARIKYSEVLQPWTPIR